MLVAKARMNHCCYIIIIKGLRVSSQQARKSEYTKRYNFISLLSANVIMLKTKNCSTQKIIKVRQLKILMLVPLLSNLRSIYFVVGALMGEICYLLLDSLF